MRMRFLTLCLLFGCIGPSCFGQATLQITFDGPPAQPPGTGYSVTNYTESGMVFRPRPPSQSFGRYGAPTDPRDPDDGTAFLRGSSLMFSFANGFLFDLISVDLAGYSSVVPDTTVNFVGYLRDGSTVQTNFSVSGIVFQTFYFGPEFNGITRAEIPVPNFGWSLDNLLVVPQAPLPVPPALAIERIWSPWVAQVRSPQIRLLWPTNLVHHQLLFNTNLPIANWTPVLTSPVIVGTNYILTNDIAGQQRFFRLRAP